MDAPTCETCPAAPAVIYTRGSVSWVWCKAHGRRFHAVLTASGFVRREVDLSEVRDARARAING